MRFRNRDIDPKKLIYFASIVEHGSLRKAAAVLNVSQPALTTSMSRLESELGLTLVTRGPTGISLTPIGHLLYSHSRMIRDEIKLAERKLFDPTDPSTTSIRFGCVPSLACNIVPIAVANWRKTHREHTLRVVDAVQFDLLNALLRHEIDLFVGFTENYNLLDGLRQRVLFRDCLRVVAQAGHPLLSKESVELADLAGYPWVFLPSGPFNMNYEDLLEQAGARLEEGSVVCDSISMLKTIIIASDHLGIMPLHAAKLELDAALIKPIALTRQEFNRSIAVFIRDGYEIDQSSSDLLDEIQTLGTSITAHFDTIGRVS